MIEMNESNCKHCYKNEEECKCTLDTILDNSGTTSNAKFGCDSIDYKIVKMDNKVVLKIKIWNDVIYLDYGGIKFINDITSRYLSIRDIMEKRRLKDWDCDSCGKKTNNGQEYCDECIEKKMDCDCL